MCDHPNREAAMPVVKRDASGKPTVWCDPCLVPLVKALNDGGLPTVASCCGHGQQPGKIALADSRELFILPDFEAARALDDHFHAQHISSALACYDCGLLYGSPGWCDCKIPDDVWLRISPTGHEGGVLCISCIARRLVGAGIDGVPLLVTSGPWDWTTDTPISSGSGATR